jgi:hypothetical protein
MGTVNFPKNPNNAQIIRSRCTNHNYYNVMVIQKRQYPEPYGSRDMMFSHLTMERPCAHVIKNGTTKTAMASEPCPSF